jgi:signal peptidase II
MPQTEVVPYGLNLTAVANQGAAMGMGQGNRPLFLAVGVVACLALSGFFVHSIRLERRRGGPTMLRSRVYRGTLAMLLAGVVGNFYDRLAYGYVRDMFHMLPDVRWSMLSRSLPDHEVFPWVFNLADSYLCVGVTVILFLSLFLPEPEPTLDDEASA